MDVAKLATKEKVARVAVWRSGTSPRARRRANFRHQKRRRARVAAPAPGGAAIIEDLGGLGSASERFGTFRGVDERALATLVQNLRGRGFADEELTGALGDLERGASARARDAVRGTRTSPSCAAAFWFGRRRTATRVSGANTRRG